MPRFRSSSKGPKEVVSELRETLLYLSHPAGSAQTNEGKRPKKHKSRGGGRKHEHSDADLTKAAGEECAALLTSLKSILFPDAAASATIDKSQLDEVVKQCYDAEVLLNLVRASVLEELPTPEARRDVVRIFRYFLERQTDNTIKYIIKNQALISNLISGYETGKPQVIANCGLMLRACSRYKSLVWVILLLKSDDVLQFFDFMQSKQFEVLSDAFVTFKELLRHDDLTAKFLEENHEEVFQRLSEVLSSDFYISKHVCLEWLQELLSESNSIREYYYSSAANLKIAMTLLGSDPSITIRFKALDLMQGFLTITEKEREVREILLMNREKLNGLVMELLTKFDKDEKHCPEPGRNFLLKTLEDPELTPALSELELVPVESGHIHDGAVTWTEEESVHDHQPNPPQDPTSEHVQPPVETIDSQNEPEPPTQDEEQSHDQSQEPDQQPLVHDPTKDEEEEEHTPDDEQSREQEQLNEPHQQDELEIEERLADQPVEEQLQAEKSNEDGESEEKPQEDDEPERKEPVSTGQPDEAEQLQPSKDSDPEEQPKEFESHEDDTEQPDSVEHLVDLSYKDQLQVESPSKDSELEEKLNDHRDDSDHPESKDPEHSITDQPNEEQLQTEESKKKDADQPETDGPLPTHSEIELEKEEQPFIDHKQPLEQQFDPSFQPEIEVILVKQSNGTEVEEPLILLHSECKESQDEAPPDHQHEGEEEHLPDQQKNEELSPVFLLSDGEEPLPDQPSERETTSLDHTEDPAGSLPDDVEDPLPNQINGDDDEQESLPDQPSENDTTLPDHKEDPPEEPLLADTEDTSPQQNEDEPKDRDSLTENEEGTLLDPIESMEKQPDHKEGPPEEPLLADAEDMLPQQNEDEPKNRDSLTVNGEGMLLDHIESMEKQLDHKEDPPEEPLLADIEDMLPQQNEDEPKNRDLLTENEEGMLLDRIESTEKQPEMKELPQNEEHKEALPDKLDDEPDHSDKAHENEGTLPEEQLFDFNFSEMPILESSQVQPLAVETVEQHLPKLLEELENVLTNNQPDTAQLQQQFHDFTKPDFDHNQVQEQQQELDDAATISELSSETQAAEQLVQDSTMIPDHSDETQGQNDDSTEPHYPPDEAQIEQQLDDSATKPVEMQEHQFDQDTTAPSHHPDESQKPPSPDKRLETPEEPLVMIEPTEEGETPKQQLLSMEEPAAQQEEHQPQPLPGKQDCTDESSEQESQLPQHDYDYHSQPVQSEDQASIKEPSEQEEEPSTEQEHSPESEPPMETREILVD